MIDFSDREDGNFVFLDPVLALVPKIYVVVHGRYSLKYLLNEWTEYLLSLFNI